MTLALIAALALSTLIGLSLGLLGGGGSILALPVLVYVAGIAPHEAVPMSLAIVGATSLVAGVLHHGSGRVSLQAAALFGAFGMGGAYFGSKLTHLVGGSTLLLLFAVLMLVVGGWMLAPFAQRLVAKAEEGRARRPRLLLTAAAGVAVGAMTGFLGVGGGFLVVPALVFFARLGIKDAVGTSLYVIAANSLAGVVGHLGDTQLRFGLTAAFIAAAVVGAVMGHALAKRTQPQRLRQRFGGFVVAVGAVVAVQSARALLTVD